MKLSLKKLRGLIRENLSNSSLAKDFLESLDAASFQVLQDALEEAGNTILRTGSLQQKLELLRDLSPGNFQMKPQFRIPPRPDLFVLGVDGRMLQLDPQERTADVSVDGKIVTVGLSADDKVDPRESGLPGGIPCVARIDRTNSMDDEFFPDEPRDTRSDRLYDNINVFADGTIMLTVMEMIREYRPGDENYDALRKSVFELILPVQNAVRKLMAFLDETEFGSSEGSRSPEENRRSAMATLRILVNTLREEEFSVSGSPMELEDGSGAFVRIMKPQWATSRMLRTFWEHLDEICAAASKGSCVVSVDREPNDPIFRDPRVVVKCK